MKDNLNRDSIIEITRIKSFRKSSFKKSGETTNSLVRATNPPITETLRDFKKKQQQKKTGIYLNYSEGVARRLSFHYWTLRTSTPCTVCF